MMTMRHIQPQHVQSLPLLSGVIQLGITETNDGIGKYISTYDALYIIDNQNEPSQLTLTSQIMMGMGIVGDTCMVVTSGSGVIQATAKSGDGTTEIATGSTSTTTSSTDMTDQSTVAPTTTPASITSTTSTTTSTSTSSSPSPSTSSSTTDSPEDILRSGFYLYSHGELTSARTRGQEFITITSSRGININTIDMMVISLITKMMDTRPFAGKMKDGMGEGE
jgi:hypothetical protein